MYVCMYVQVLIYERNLFLCATVVSYSLICHNGCHCHFPLSWICHQKCTSLLSGWVHLHFLLCLSCRWLWNVLTWVLVLPSIFSNLNILTCFVTTKKCYIFQTCMHAWVCTFLVFQHEIDVKTCHEKTKKTKTIYKAINYWSIFCLCVKRFLISLSFVLDSMRF